MVYYYAKTTSAPLIWVRSFNSLQQGYCLEIKTCVFVIFIIAPLQWVEGPSRFKRHEMPLMDRELFGLVGNIGHKDAIGHSCRLSCPVS